MWDFGCAEPTEMLCIKAFWWLTHIMTKSRISWKSMPKWTPKVIPKSTFGRSGVRLLRFLAVFWGMRFLISFGMCKKSTKNEKSSALGRKRQKSGQLLGRVGGRGGRPGNLVLLVLGQTLAEGPTRLAPPSKDGVGGSTSRARQPAAPRAICMWCAKIRKNVVFFLKKYDKTWYFMRCSSKVWERNKKKR